jgi:tight adherence protein B
MTNYSEYIFTDRQRYMIWVLIALLGIAVSLLFYRNIFFAPVIIPFSPRIKDFIRDHLTEKRKHQLLEQFKDFLFTASTSIGAGRGMKDAIGESIPAIEGIYGRDAILVRELRGIHERLEVGNEDEIDVLMDFAERSDLEDVYDFVTAYSACRTTGASLITALNKAASVIIDKLTIENEIRELVRRKKSEGMMIFLMPLIVIVFLNLMAPDYIAPLYTTFTGRLIMTMTIAADIGIYALISGIVKIDI